MDKLITILQELFTNKTLVSAIWSNPKIKQDYPTKITLRPTILQGNYIYQFEVLNNNQAHHFNIDYDSISSFIKNNAYEFKQIQIYSSKQDYSILINKKYQANIKLKAPIMNNIWCLNYSFKRI